MTPEEKREAEVVAEYGVHGIVYDGPENGEPMSKHTPGPWEIDGGERDPAKPFALPRWTLYRHVEHDTSGMTGTGIVASTTSRFAYLRATDEDARLIAAAPDLLEAAKHAAMEWRLHGQLPDSCRVLEAAIAKAENGEPDND